MKEVNTMADSLELVTLEEAARIVGKTPYNIRDYIQRGRIQKYNKYGASIKYARDGELRISLEEIKTFLLLVEQGLQKHHHAGLHPELGFHIESIVSIFRNILPSLKPDAQIFVVANDRFRL